MIDEWIHIRDVAILKYEKVDSFFWLRYLPNAVISLIAVEEIIRNVESLANDEKYAILADFRGVAYIEEEARPALLHNPQQLIAIAVIIDQRKQKPLVDIFFREYVPDYLYKFFFDDVSAKDWLNQQVKQIYE